MYILRKKINEKEWILNKGIATYDDFCDELRKLGIKVPVVSLEDKLFPKPKEEPKEDKKLERKPKRNIGKRDEEIS